MARYNHPFIRPGEYDLGEGRRLAFTREELSEIARNTQALIQEGYRIPVLKDHSAPGSPIRSPQEGLEEEAVGSVIGIHQQEDGSLHYELELADANAEQLMDQEKKVHSSPEIRTSFSDHSGKSWGPMIAHVALTDRPRYEGQPPLRPSEEEPSTQNRQTEDEEVQETSSKQSPSHSEMTPNKEAEEEIIPKGDASAPLLDPTEPIEENPDSSDSHSDTAPLVESPETDEASRASNPISVAEAVLGPEEFESPSLGNAASLTQRRAYRDALLARIHDSRHIPLGLRKRLASAVSAVQLSRDGEEEPTLRLSDAVTLIEEALPEQAMLDPSQLLRVNHPHGESFFRGGAGALSDEEAEGIAREQLAAAGFAAGSRGT